MSEQVTLLFQNNHRSSLSASEFSRSRITSVTTDELINYIYNHWDEDMQGVPPTSMKQIRLIHLGRPLDTAKVTTIGDLNLEFSDIIHVVVRPLESLEKKKSKRSLNLNRKISNKLDDQQGNETERNDEDHNSHEQSKDSGGCCIIV